MDGRLLGGGYSIQIRVFAAGTDASPATVKAWTQAIALSRVLDLGAVFPHAAPKPSPFACVYDKSRMRQRVSLSSSFALGQHHDSHRWVRVGLVNPCRRR